MKINNSNHIKIVYNARKNNCKIPEITDILKQLIKDNKLDFDKSKNLVLLTKKNAKIIENIILNDPDYIPLREFCISKKCLNYTAWSKKRFIKNNELISIKIYYIKGKVITGLIGCPCAIYMRDINDKYWHQPLFAPTNETDNSIMCSFKDFKDATDIDTAIKCFRGELPW